MKKSVVLIILLLGACSGNMVDETTICAIMPLTGEWAFVGEQAALGLERAAEEHNVRLILEDDQYDPTKTVTAARKLIAQGCKSLQVPFIENALPIADIAREHNVPVNLIYDGTVHVDNDPILYTSGFSVEGAGYLMADFVQERSVVVVRDQNDFSITLTDAFVEKFEGEKEVITITENEDFRTLVTKIKASNPEAIYFGFAQNDAVLFIDSLKEQEVDARLYTTVQFSPDKIERAGESANGICKTSLPRVTVFQDAMIPEWAALGYDAAIANIIGKGNFDNLRFTSITGDTIDMNGPARDEVIYCIKNGQLILQ